MDVVLKHPADSLIDDDDDGAGDSGSEVAGDSSPSRSSSSLSSPPASSSFPPSSITSSSSVVFLNLPLLLLLSLPEVTGVGTCSAISSAAASTASSEPISTIVSPFLPPAFLISHSFLTHTHALSLCLSPSFSHTRFVFHSTPHYIPAFPPSPQSPPSFPLVSTLTPTPHNICL